jgi:putative aminopeptidase FrvX
MKLLKELCSIAATSGNELTIKQFIIKYVEENILNFKVTPSIISENIQDCIILKFGNPKTAIFAHLDSVGFTVRYGKELVKIGGPKSYDGIKLIGKDSKGKIETEIYNYEDENGHHHIEYLLDREIDRATELTFKPDWRENKNFIQCCYMDNRLGVWNALEVAKTLENGVICFSTYEEVGGGSVGFLAKYIYENFKINQALISDVTWITNGVQHGNGVVISRRDSGLPRRSYVDKIIYLAKKSKIPFQIEVESSGGSDGNQLQKSPYPFDWCFIGAAEDFVHSPDEKVHKSDIDSMVNLYKYLMVQL